VYEAHCAQCHGESGGGDGLAAGRYPIPSTNFRIQRIDYEPGVRAIRDGMQGTPMAPWGNQLSATEVDALMRYIQGMYQP
jgi:mono/diheme cytochrome c family protein